MATPAYRKLTAGKKERKNFYDISPAGKDKDAVKKGMEKFYEKRPHLKPLSRWDRRSNNALFGREDISDE